MNTLQNLIEQADLIYVESWEAGVSHQDNDTIRVYWCGGDCCALFDGNQKVILNADGEADIPDMEEAEPYTFTFLAIQPLKPAP